MIIIATALAQTGKEEQLKKALNDVANPTRQQAGSVEFSLYQDKNNPNLIVGFERWASEADHDKHLQGEHVKLLFAAMGDVLAAPPVISTYHIINEI